MLKDSGAGGGTGSGKNPWAALPVLIGSPSILNFNTIIYNFDERIACLPRFKNKNRKMNIQIDCNI